ncbi:MAG: ymfK [Gammaproteobacteria bacterium]|jgi:SOS-response transcriptional repressor LexA|nr:ymfK [Gammaproteobacteria bacterium]
MSRNVKDIRRDNMRALAESIGGITAMAERLGKSQSQISHLIGYTPIKNIGDRIAAEVEKAFGKPFGWLDRDHFGITEEAATHAQRIVSQYITVPLISWVEANQWQYLQKDYPPTRAETIIPVITKINKKSFALRMHNDSMQTNHSLTIPHGAVAVIDIGAKPKQGDLIVVANAKKYDPDSKQEALMGQYTTEGGRRLVKPLNDKHQATEINSNMIINGVIRQIIHVFE